MSEYKEDVVLKQLELMTETMERSLDVAKQLKERIELVETDLKQTSIQTIILMDKVKALEEYNG